MSWINKILPSGVRSQESEKRSNVPEGLWKKCVKCDAVLYRPDVDRNDDVCPKCDHHMRIGARRRLAIFLDQDTGEEILADIEPVDRLKFRDKKRYRDRLSAAQKSTGEKDALVAMRGELRGLPIVCVAFEFNFHGGSMGYAVGEKFTRAAHLALEQRAPLVCFAASGGARMQEALISLMQMAKTSAVLERMKLQGVPYISVCLHRWPCWAMSISQSRTRAPVLPVPISSNRPFARNCPRAFSAVNSCWSTARST